MDDARRFVKAVLSDFLTGAFLALAERQKQELKKTLVLIAAAAPDGRDRGETWRRLLRETPLSAPEVQHLCAPAPEFTKPKRNAIKRDAGRDVFQDARRDVFPDAGRDAFPDAAHTRMPKPCDLQNLFK